MSEVIDEIDGMSRFIADQESLRESIQMIADMRVPPETHLLDFVLVTTQLLSEQVGTEFIGWQDYERRVITAFDYGLVELDNVLNRAYLRTQLLNVFLSANRNRLFDLDAQGNKLSVRGLARFAQIWAPETRAISYQTVASGPTL